MPVTITPWEVTRFKEWLKDKEDILQRDLEDSLGITLGNNIIKSAVQLVLKRIDAELNYEFEESSKELSKNTLDK